MLHAELNFYVLGEVSKKVYRYPVSMIMSPATSNFVNSVCGQSYESEPYSR